MDAESVLRTVVSLIPNWYFAEYGPHQYHITAGSSSLSFCSHRAMTPSLDSYFNLIGRSVGKVVEHPDVGIPGFADLLQQMYAMYWLSSQCKGVNWRKVLGYVHSLSKRTYENQPVSMNLVIRHGEGGHDLTTPDCQKFLDQLASSPFTYFSVDGELRLIGYEQIAWSQIADAASYKFHPEFLHPFHGILQKGDCSIHLTSTGDLVILNSAGMLAAKRKGQWKVYDILTFKNLVVDCMGDYYIGANLFELLFDLSFKRHGALLIYDPKRLVLPQVVNPESILTAHSDASSGQAMLGWTVKDVAIGRSLSGLVLKKRILMELASVDGAIVFDDDHILAVGAVIKPHDKVGNRSGARTTAALSAYHWGGCPAKVSSDGQITLYFQSRNDKGSCLAHLEFL